MKRFALTLLSLLMFLSASAAEKRLSALFGYSMFYLPESNQPYVETYLNFNAWSLNFVQEEDGRYRATVEVTLVARRGDTVAYVKKYDLHSPYTNSPDRTDFTFFDLQRFGLPNGLYDLELRLRDKAVEGQSYVMNEKLVVFFQSNKPATSTLQLMASATPTTTENMLSRGGYDMVPYVDDFVPAEVNQLNPYLELYHLDKALEGTRFFVSTYIEQKETGIRVPGIGNRRDHTVSVPVTSLYTSVDISSLPSGNYTLVLDVENGQGESLMKRTVDFQRSNPGVLALGASDEEVATSFAALITDSEALSLYLDALYPLANNTEMKAARRLAREGSLQEMQSFFYWFWKQRDPMNPEGRWLKYRERLFYVQEHFSYPRTPGYMTDRGRVYLQYGPPDFVRDEKNFVGMLDYVNRHATSTPLTASSFSTGESQPGQIHYLPYQLWRYNLIEGDYENRVFLFWDEMRGGYYRLLHSNARGEVQTSGWERMLSRNQLGEDEVGEVGVQFQRGF